MRVMISGPWGQGNNLSEPGPECRLVSKGELDSFLKEQFAGDFYVTNGAGAVIHEFGPDAVMHTAEGPFLPTGHPTEKPPTVTVVTRKDGKPFYVGPMF